MAVNDSVHLGGPGVYRAPPNTLYTEKLWKVEEVIGVMKEAGRGKGKLGLSLILFLLLPQPIKMKAEF